MSGQKPKCSSVCVNGPNSNAKLYKFKYLYFIARYKTVAIYGRGNTFTMHTIFINVYIYKYIYIHIYIYIYNCVSLTA